MRAASVAPRTVALVVPGSLETLTGGYLYDRHMLEGLRRAGWETRAVTLDPSFPEPTAAALQHARASLAALPPGRLIVIDGLALAGLLPLLPWISLRFAAVALIHHPLADETGISAGRARALRAAEAAALAAVRRIVVTSHWTRRRLVEAYGVEPDRVAVVEPGVERRDLPERSAAPWVRLLTVATLTPRKGHAVLIEALARLRDLDWTLRCVGSRERDPECAAALVARIEALELGDRIRLLGELAPQALCNEYAAADLFVLPSYLEGYGMALVEAIAHGLPVVSTLAGAIPDTLPARAGCLVPPGDVTALAATLRRLITDAEARAALGAGARAAAGAMPDWTQAAERFAAALAVVADA